MPWGGAYNQVASDATAFPHRDERFLVQHLVDTDSDAQLDAGRGWLSRSWGLLHPFASGGVYPNFPDPDLPDWDRAYFGENCSRLRKVKATYDPDNFFSLISRFSRPVERVAYVSVPPSPVCADY